MIDDTEIREQIKSITESNSAVMTMLQRIIAMVLGTVIVLACLLIDSELSKTIGLALATGIGVVGAYLFTKKKSDDDEM